MGGADLATDGRWCFLALWVIARESQFPTTRASQVPIRWMLLKQRLEDVCPSALPSLLPHPAPEVHLSQRVMLLQVCSSDRTGLLNGAPKLLLLVPPHLSRSSFWSLRSMTTRIIESQLEFFPERCVHFLTISCFSF